ncbi:MAG: hypothetical protein DRQ88_10420 [Epsilonproteobacteria bacterium]|nr:MAG: hypothetical protein DRQ88_10420 [Campylobacterota bacterium]RLA65826.1 MAG: hypothetical protein DRQ89_00300 [Campylobacterota bacterium]
MKKIKDDFGLGIISLLIILYNFIFFIGLLVSGHFSPKILIPCLVAGILLVIRRFVILLPDILKVIIIYGLSLFSALYNYTYIAGLDEIIKFKRLDFFFAQFDMLAFNMPVADFIGSFFPFNTSYGWFFNDLIMANYILFYFLGLYAILIFFFSLDEKHRYKVGMCVTSFLIFMGINHFIYILVPVSGPQYFQAQLFSEKIPFSVVGSYLFNVVLDRQVNLIDCFPSGHFGVALLATLWAFKVNRYHYYFMIFVSLCMFLATLRLRFHYSLDLLFSPFLVILAYLLSFKLFSEK